jgi:hypothetical protein
MLYTSLPNWVVLSLGTSPFDLAFLTAQGCLYSTYSELLVEPSKVQVQAAQIEVSSK